jgi:DNA polymerase I
LTTNSDNIRIFVDKYNEHQPQIVVYDTETTGLNILKDTPFLMAFGFEKCIFVMKPTAENLKIVYDTILKSKVLIAHNAKFDYHMMINSGHPIPEHIKLGDSLTIARLTEYADVDDRIGLEALGAKYVDINSKFAGKVIQQKINEIERAHLSEIKKTLKLTYKLKSVSDIWEAYKNRVQFLKYEWDEMFNFIDQHYKKANYETVYHMEPDLMTHYLADDIAILLEYLKVSLPVLEKVDPGYRVFKQENELIRIVGDMERIGVRADIDYLIQSRERVLNYKSLKYDSLKEMTGINFSVGQHKVIKNLFEQKYHLTMDKTDIEALKKISKIGGEAGEIAELIVELRTIDKWLSTYIEGMMNRVYEGRIHTSINNAGTVTGRVSSDLQQQPKNPLLDKDGNELFHPRRVFIADPNTSIIYFDYSQMELRLQAHYTIQVSGGDTNLCRAFMPFQCIDDTGKVYQYGDDMNKKWFDENGKVWEPIDLHSVTTLKAFPHLTIDHPEFKNYRPLGKVANFLKNYAGGIGAIQEQLGVSEDIAKALNDGYYQAFPKVLDYQKWIESTLAKQGYVSNIFGRRYYIRDFSKYYKAYNYMIQGGCADLLKNKEIKVHNYLKRNNLQSKMLLPVHDELQIQVVKGEEWIIPQIKAILDNNDEYIGTLPMTCDIEITHTSWADKEEL